MCLTGEHCYMKIYLTMASWLINHEVCERDELIYPAVILLKFGTQMTFGVSRLEILCGAEIAERGSWLLHYDRHLISHSHPLASVREDRYC